LPPEAGSIEIDQQSFGRQTLPQSTMPGSLPKQEGSKAFVPPTSGYSISGAGSPPEEDIMYSACSGSSFVPHPGLKASGYSSMEDSFLPHPNNGLGRSSLASISEQSVRSSFSNKSPQGEAIPSGQSKLATGVCNSTYRTGDQLEVWSGSQQAWLPGSVLAAFDTETSVDGFKVPAGTVKVTSAAGVKWVLPDQRTKMLRRSSSAVTKYQKGDRVKVWSDSNQIWLDGVVEEAYSTVSAGNGFTIPAGTLLVKSSAGASKWILPENIDKTLRLGDSRNPTAGGVADFTQGEKILVWSDRRQDWLLGVVQSFFPEACSAEGFDVPAGSVKVMSATGEKWVLPKDRDRLLRKVEDSGSEPDLKDMIGSILQRPTALHRQAEAIWTSSLRPGENALPVERAAWALEGLSSQFGVQVELDGSYAEAVRQKAESISRGQKSLTVEAFQALCRETMSEVHGKL